MNRKVKLDSDFRDYYDHWFAGSHDEISHVYSRFTNNGLSKAEQFNRLNLLGLNTPKNGLLSDLISDNIDGKFVVYTDPFKHAGEGKVLIETIEENEQFKTCFSSLFLQPDIYLKKSGSLSYRYLRVGINYFWIIYIGKTDWRSNYGEVETILLDHYETPAGLIAIAKQLKKTDLPMICAIDFVHHKEQYFAIDYNTAPCIKGSGVEQILPGINVYKAISSSIEVIQVQTEKSIS